MSLIYDYKIKPKLNEIVKLRAQGKSTAHIAKYLDIEEYELQLEIQEQTDLYNAWYKGEAYLIEEIEKALYRAAIGHEVQERETIETTDDEGKVTRTTKIKTKFVQSIPAAIKALETIHAQRWANAGRANNEIEIILPKELIEYAE